MNEETIKHYKFVVNLPKFALAKLYRLNTSFNKYYTITLIFFSHSILQCKQHLWYNEMYNKNVCVAYTKPMFFERKKKAAIAQSKMIFLVHDVLIKFNKGAMIYYK